MLVIKDFATTILASALTAAATSVVVSDASRLPALSAGDYYYLVLQKFTNRTSVEVVKVTGVSGNTLTVVRAQAGTTAKSFAIGDYAEQRVTVGTFSEYIAQSVAGKVNKSDGYVEQSLGLFNTGDLVKATVGISYDAVNGHGTILSGGDGANKVTPYVALRPLGVADSSVQMKYAQDGSLILSGGSRYVETGLLSMKHPSDANGWPNAINADANNYNNRARGKVHVNNNALYFIADGAFDARRFGIQSGHEDPGYATAYGILDLNPFGGTVRVNGGTVYHTNYVPTPAAVGALALSGGTLTGTLDQSMGGYGGRMTAAGSYAYLQGGKVGGDTADQKLKITGISATALTEFDIITAGHGIARVNGARIYTEQYVPTPAVLGVVPQARTINSHPLTSDITLSAADVGAVAAVDNTYWRGRGQKADLNTADNARPGYFSAVPTSVGMPIGTYGHGLTVGPGADAQYGVWYSQILFGHNNRIYTRNGVNGAAAGAWNYIFTSTDKPTASDVGAVNKTGDTMTGTLRAPFVYILGNGADKAMFGAGPADIFIHNIVAGKYLQLKDDGTLQYSDQKVYHQGFKPTAADVGAVACNASGIVNQVVDFKACRGIYTGSSSTPLELGHGESIPNTFYVDIHTDSAADFNYRWSYHHGAPGVHFSGTGDFSDIYIRSDKRLKTRLAKLVGSLDKVRRLTGYEFDKAASLGSDVVHREVGLLADDVQAVLPYAVRESADEDAIKTISPSALIALLVEAIKELDERTA